MRLDLRLGDLLPGGRIRARPAVACERGQLGHRALKACGLRKTAPLESENRHCDLPAVARIADQVAVIDFRVGEKDLAELPAASHLLDAPDLDARLLHVDEEKTDAPVRLGARIRAREKEALLRIVRAARPGFLSAEYPLAVSPLRLCSQSGEVAARVGLAETLAEDQLAAQDLVDVGLFLPGGAVRQEGWRQERHAEATEDAGRAGFRHLLLVDRLHHRRRASTAGLFGPSELQPAALVELALPFPLQLRVLFVAIASLSVLSPVPREIRVEPASNLGPEGFLLGREAQIHGFEDSWRRHETREAAGAKERAP